MHLLARVLLLAVLVSPLSALSARMKVPVDVGVGPAGYFFFGPVNDSRWPVPHFGLKLNVHAVIDDELIAANRHAIPPKYRKMAEGVTEVRISPSLLIPDALIISPKLDSLGGTGMYGVTWRPVSLGVPLAGRKRPGSYQKSAAHIDLSAGLLLTYAYLYSDVHPTTHFIRPGIDVMLKLQLNVSKSFLISLGWAHQFYVPQQLGGFGIGPLEESIFHVGQPFLKLHVRFPYEVNL